MVDLESVSYVAAASEAGIPWLVLRAVSDTAAEALPALLNRCRDEGGAVRRAKVALELMGDPRALPFLLSLRQRIRHCAETLADAIEALLRSCAATAVGEPVSVQSAAGAGQADDQGGGRLAAESGGPS